MSIDLKPCPFCGSVAHFQMDEDRWEWVECESCRMQGNRGASLLGDCKPKLAEKWNLRAAVPADLEASQAKIARLRAVLEKLLANGTAYYSAFEADFGFDIEEWAAEAREALK